MRPSWARMLAVGAIAVALATAPCALAADGSLDKSFGSSGHAIASMGTLAVAAAAVVQPDGKIVTAGEVHVNGVDKLASTRMLSNGTLDPSYGQGGWATLDINGS